jgi:hypothetical protein
VVCELRGVYIMPHLHMQEPHRTLAMVPRRKKKLKTILERTCIALYNP